MLEDFVVHKMVMMVMVKIRGRREHRQGRHRGVSRHRVIRQAANALLSLDLSRYVGELFRHRVPAKGPLDGEGRLFGRPRSSIFLFEDLELFGNEVLAQLVRLGVVISVLTRHGQMATLGRGFKGVGSIFGRRALQIAKEPWTLCVPARQPLTRCFT